MKIGLFIDAFYPMVDGVINVVDNYAKELSRYADVTVFCPRVEGAKIDEKPYKIVWCSSISIPKFDYAIPTPSLDSSFAKTLKKYQLDIVHAHSPFNLCQKAKKYAKKKNIPFIGTIHSKYKKDFEKALKFSLPLSIASASVLSFYNSCDECWTVNQGMLDIYKNELGLTAPCKVMPNATNHLPVENLDSAIKRINFTFGLKEGELTFLFVGRLTFQKNLELIIHALAILKEKGIKFKMLFVGSGADEEELIKMISKLKLCDEVVLCGRITDKSVLQCLYARAKLLLFPSLYDASSLVQIEAACQKTPTLFVEGATTATGIVKDKNGFISKPDKNSYAEEIIRIISSQSLYEKVCDGCYQDLYVTWDQTIKNVYKEYERIINEKQMRAKSRKPRLSLSFFKNKTRL